MTDFFAVPTSALAGPLSRRASKNTPLPLAWRNRRLVAERLAWPRDALLGCEHLETLHPNWRVFYFTANTTPGFERPAGFEARYDQAGGHKLTLFRETVDELGELMVDPPPHQWKGCAWCVGQIGRR